MYIENEDRTKHPDPQILKTDKPADIASPELLVIGIGNCGRADDGLGWAFLEQLEQDNTPVNTAYRYQLQIEDAERISHHPFIIFVDASEEVLPDGFRWRKCPPAGSFNFSTHELSPETILGLCTHLYGTKPQAYVLAIQGYEWGLKEGLSKEAQQNLQKALRFFDAMIL